MAHRVTTKAWNAARRLPPVVGMLALLYGINVLALMRLDTGIIYPIYLPDEAEYAVAGHNLLTLHTFRFEGMFPTLIPPLYPAVVAIGRAFAANGASTLSMSVLDHLLIEAVIFPAFALARRLGVAQAPSIMAAVAAAWAVNMWEAAHYLSEVVYYPLFATVCVAVLAYFQLPGVKRAVLVGALLGLALLTKNSGAALSLAWWLANLGALMFPLLTDRSAIGNFVRSAPFRTHLLWPLVGGGVTALLYGPWALWRSSTLQSCAACTGESSIFLQAVRRPEILLHYFPLYAETLFFSLGVLVLPLALLGMLRGSGKMVELRAQALFLGLIIVVVLAMAATFSGYTLNQVRDRHLFVLTPVLLALAGAGLQTLHRLPVWKLLVGFALVSAAEVAVYFAGNFTSLSQAAATPWSFVLNTPWVYGLGAWATKIAGVTTPMAWNVHAFFLGLVVVAVAFQLLWLITPALRATLFYGMTFMFCVATLLPVLQAAASANVFDHAPYEGRAGLSQWLSDEIGPDQTLAFVGCDPLSPCFRQQSAMAKNALMGAYGKDYVNIYYAEAADMYEMVPVPDLQRLPSVEARVHAAYLLSPQALAGLPEMSHFGVIHLYDLRAYSANPQAAPAVRRSSSPGCFAEDLQATRLPATIRANATFSVAVHIHNSSSCQWSASGPDPIVISYHWLSPSGDVIGEFINPPSLLPHDLAPGQAAWATVQVTAPSSPGAAVLVIDLATYRGAGAFEAAGGAPLLLPEHIAS